jgi:hypothetical protein
MSRDAEAIPGKTSNQCFLCWYILTRGLADGVNGGGGQVGNWADTRPNAFTGDILPLGIKK